jgi:PhzF family phenazine biosynthesis protein
MSPGNLYKLSAFTTDPTAGNPAGVWVGETLPDARTMQEIAAKVGFSETAFIMPKTGFERKVRYFSPEKEVPFCGHATIATGVQLAKLNGEGEYFFDTLAGNIPVRVDQRDDEILASLTSVEPKHTIAKNSLVAEVLSTLNWQFSDLDPSISPACAYAGAWHLVLAVSSKARLDDLDYDFDALKAIMLREDITTLQLVWKESDAQYHSRNPFPVGGVIEDPATGAAAAALGGYLRDAKLIATPSKILIHQGEAMGRPSLLNVEIPKQGGIIVSGTAVAL